jgi:acid phosphatase
MLRLAVVALIGCVFAANAVRAQSGIAVLQPVDPRLGCTTVKTFPVPDLGEPENIDTFKKQLLYYRCMTYDDDVAKVLADAQRWIALRAPQVQKPAIVLDIDETSLSNWPRIYQDDYAYIPAGACDFRNTGDPCGDLDWQQSALAKAIEPTLKLYKTARCIAVDGPCTPVDVFFITGRREVEHNHEMPSVWTLRNLDQAGFGTVNTDHLYMRGTAEDGGVASYKASKRADVESKGFTIIANIGDQKSDLANGHAEMTFKVPNPFYFIPSE